MKRSTLTRLTADEEIVLDAITRLGRYVTSGELATFGYRQHAARMGSRRRNRALSSLVDRGILVRLEVERPAIQRDRTPFRVYHLKEAD